MTSKNVYISCVVGQVWNRANNKNTRDELRRQELKIHAVIESEAARYGEEVGKSRYSSRPAPQVK